MDKNYFQKILKDENKIFKSNEVEHLPKKALIELTNGCNHSCIFCYNPEMKRKINHIDFETYKKFISMGIDEGLEEVGLYSTGEPFMTKNLQDYIFEAKKIGIKRVYITTNGALASIEKVEKCIDAGLDSIKFSINAGTRESYKLIHGQDDFEKVINNLNAIYDYKIKKKIDLQLLCSFVYTDLTKKETQEFKQNFGKFFEDILFVAAENQGGRTGDKVDELVATDKVDKSTSFKPCGMIWDKIHLTNEGHFTACCVDYENDLVFQKFDPSISILKQFNNSKIKNLRDKHLNNKLEGTICQNCIYNKNENFDKIDETLTNNMSFVSKKINDRKTANIKNRLNQHFEKVKVSKNF